MISIKETESTVGFVSGVFFERTELVKEKVVDCTREELIDLVFHQLNMLEKVQGFSENLNRELEEHLGYNEEL